jgi:hypothetical protein
MGDAAGLRCEGPAYMSMQFLGIKQYVMGGGHALGRTVRRTGVVQHQMQVRQKPQANSCMSVLRKLAVRHESSLFGVP